MGYHKIYLDNNNATSQLHMPIFLSMLFVMRKHVAILQPSQFSEHSTKYINLEYIASSLMSSLMILHQTVSCVYSYTYCTTAVCKILLHIIIYNFISQLTALQVNQLLQNNIVKLIIIIHLLDFSLAKRCPKFATKLDVSQYWQLHNNYYSLS